MKKIIQFLNVRKEFSNGNIIANDDISFFINKGEVHAIAGENGAGKSTLISILFGMYKQTQGKIIVRDKEINYRSALDAMQDGLGMVHQHFQLVENFTVAENIVLGSENSRLNYQEKSSLQKEIKQLRNQNINFKKQLEIQKKLNKNQTSKYSFLQRKKINQIVNDLAKKYHFNIKAQDKISSLTVGQEQKVEILKLLYKNSDILIFDEPTAMLTPNEIKEFINIVLHLKKQGKTIIIITHKLDEIKKVADRVTILRRGKYVGTENAKTITSLKLSKMMVGYKIVHPKLTKNKVGANVLEIKNLSVVQKRVTKLHKINFAVKKGEIVAIAGVEGNGQTELAMAISGFINKYQGTILINDKSIEKLSISQRNKMLSHIPEDRHKHGIILDLKSYENIVGKNLKANSRFSFLNKDKMNKLALQIIQDFDVRGADMGRSISRSLSGGNQQKLVVGREISLNRDLLISFQATRGLDVGAKNYIHNQIIKARNNHKAVLLISYDLNEVLELSDRIIILNSGKIIGEVAGKNISRNQVGILMSGKGSD